jgi:hypothetical protein
VVTVLARAYARRAIRHRFKGRSGQWAETVPERSAARAELLSHARPIEIIQRRACLRGFDSPMDFSVKALGFLPEITQGRNVARACPNATTLAHQGRRGGVHPITAWTLSGRSLRSATMKSPRRPKSVIS